MTKYPPFLDDCPKLEFEDIYENYSPDNAKESNSLESPLW